MNIRFRRILFGSAPLRPPVTGVTITYEGEAVTYGGLPITYAG